MDIDLSRYDYNGEWVEFKPGVRLKIRPYPQSLSAFTMSSDTELVVQGKNNLKMFDYCLTDWDGINVTLNDESQACTSEVKKMIFDFDIENIPGFVLSKVREMQKRSDENGKN